MRIPGRSWWVYALLACVLGFASIGAPVAMLSLMLPDELLYSDSPTASITLASIYFLFLTIFSLGFAMLSAATWRQYRRRKQALHGELDAMPLAYSVGDTETELDLSTSPLSLHWRMQMPSVDVYVFSVLAIFALGAIASITFFAIQTMPVSLHGQVLVYRWLPNIFMWLILLGLIAGVIPLITRYRFQWRHSFGVTATTSGLECIHPTGRRTFIPWTEARLFEITAFGWRLYSADDMAELTLRPAQSGGGITYSTTDYLTPDKVKQRAKALAQTICVRTGLQPRTFYILQIATSDGIPRMRVAWSIFVACLAALSLVMAIGIVAIPLTDSTWLNVALGVPLIVCMIQQVQLFIKSHRLLTSQSTLLDVQRDTRTAKDALSTPDAVPTVLMGPDRGSRLRVAAIGAFALVDFIPLAIQLRGADHNAMVPLPHLTTGLLAVLFGAMPVLLAIYAFIVSCFGLFAVYGRGGYVQADSTGLTTIVGSTSAPHPWTEIADIKLRLVDGIAERYVVYDRYGRRLAWWPILPGSAALSGPPPDSRLLSPAEFGQLVCRHIDQAKA